MRIRTWVRDYIFSIGKRALRRREIRHYLATETNHRLNIGCGGNRISGWLNVDRFPPPGATFVDATIVLPFDDATFRAILCEHMIEHIPKAAAIYLLGEMRRILLPGGIARIVTPDLDWFSRRIVEPSPIGAVDDEYLIFLRNWHNQNKTSWCDAINLCFYDHGHRYIWSVRELCELMEGAGFVDIAITRAGHSDNPMFSGVDGHGRLIGELPNALEAFGLEGRSPV